MSDMAADAFLRMKRVELLIAILDGFSDQFSCRPVLSQIYSSYGAYIAYQLNKTLNPKLRQIWKTRDWNRKVRVFAKFFESFKQGNLLFNDSKALSIGARVGQEVAALKWVRVSDSVGIDLVPHPPFVVKGDFHTQPFEKETFDFEFSNVFDHALYPWKFVGEIERTLRPVGFVFYSWRYRYGRINILRMICLA
ncbi:S-adenosyl-L-methionine-dependent methyltransferases superfamily protein isoform 2 [Tripterygium wilfordii]|uniref:S-adenosyl-L-methionine-dependent methyltransferases superfamily protein isoform 2 n=1 Tax=Tripterygium wilfordii TaxID=458696 RepID=A0A7J7DBI3_TRIWF|nr:S-adenosyl-L-methionine-dependent methyltransferases superfamily protein isoform 2 [Tripterygium wilfordii]